MAEQMNKNESSDSSRKDNASKSMPGQNQDKSQPRTAGAGSDQQQSNRDGNAKHTEPRKDATSKNLA